MSAASLSRIASDGLRGARRAATRVAIPLAAILGLSACVTPPPRVVAVPSPPPRPQTVFVYPNNGQSAEQTDRDRYECHLWAVQQTGVDPSRADANPYERVVVQPATPPGANTAAGAVTGAILGAIIAGPRAAGAGLVLGGATGAIVGSAADANAQQQARQTQQQINMNASQGRARADSYRRALGACLEGRGYTVS
ncbi:MAG: glycine zipper family protein [Steroidobacteraceae bacterium]